jgi:hypothetical protein
MWGAFSQQRKTIPSGASLAAEADEGNEDRVKNRRSPSRPDRRDCAQASEQKAFTRAEDGPFGSLLRRKPWTNRPYSPLRRADYQSAAGYQPTPQVLQNQYQVGGFLESVNAARSPDHSYFGNSNGSASSDVNMHRALCPHSGTILTT